MYTVIMLKHRGITYADIIVLLICAGFVGLLILNHSQGTRDYSSNASCYDNLRQIGQAILMYANDNHEFPRTRWDRNSTTLNFYTNPNASNPFASDGPLPNDVTASLYLLIRTQDLSPKLFHCPNVHDHGPLTSVEEAKARTNFVGPQELDYSVANPFPSPVAVAAGYRWDLVDFALAADMNPGVDALKAVRAGANAIGNSLNHYKTGQNVLYGDFHVAHVSNCFAGVGCDNIYTYGVGTAQGIVGSPQFAGDSILLPTAPSNRAASITPEVMDKRISMGLWSIFLGLIALAVLIAIVRIRKRLPLILARRRYKKVKRSIIFRKCPMCGYDIRATPERCPECGAVMRALLEQAAGEFLPQITSHSKRSA